MVANTEACGRDRPGGRNLGELSEPTEAVLVDVVSIVEVKELGCAEF